MSVDVVCSVVWFVVVVWFVLPFVCGCCCCCCWWCYFVVLPTYSPPLPLPGYSFYNSLLPLTPATTVQPTCYNLTL